MILASWSLPGRPLQGIFGYLGVLLGRLGDTLRRRDAFLECHGALCGRCSAVLELFGGSGCPCDPPPPPGAPVLGRLGALLGPVGSFLGRLGVFFGASWTVVRAVKAGKVYMLKCMFSK